MNISEIKKTMIKKGISAESLGVKLRLIETVSSPISSNGEKYCEHLFEIV